MGDVFEGRRLRPGSNLPESELWDTLGRSCAPLLLEYAGSDRSGHGHKRSQHLYILWSYDPERHDWLELARTSAEGVEWVDVLRPVALRHLAGSAPKGGAATAGATSRVLTVLETELETLDTDGRCNLLGNVWEQFLARLVRERVPERPEHV
jgi:hypothetical protein